jgi:hypothetical protein
MWTVDLFSFKLYHPSATAVARVGLPHEPKGM